MANRPGVLATALASLFVAAMPDAIDAQKKENSVQGIQETKRDDIKALLERMDALEK